MAQPGSSQPRHPGRRALAAALGLAFLCGCGAPGPRRAAATDPSGSLSETALERRAQGHAHYAAGILADVEGRETEALTHFEQAALADLDNAILVLQTAGRLLQARQTDRAIALLRQAAQPARAPALFLAWLGLAQLQKGDWQAAVQANRDALRRDPTLLLAYQNLVAIHTEQRQPDQALQIIREAGSQTSLDPAYFTTVAELYHGFARLQPDQADALKPATLDLLHRAAALKPNNPFVIERLAQGYRQLGELESAQTLYRDLLRRVPGAPMARESLVDLYLRTDKREEAKLLLEQLLLEQPTNERARFVLGAIALQENRLEEAEQQLLSALALEPRFEPAYYELAAVRISRDRPNDALATLARVRELWPRRETFLLEFYSGLAHARAKRYDEATRHFTQAELIATKDEPERLNPHFYFQFGAAAERRGDRTAAATHFRKCLERSPDFAEALNYLGYMWAEHGENLDEARTLIERAVKLEPDNEAFLDSLGWVLFKQGHSAEALPWLQKAVDKAQEPDATLYDHLGDVHAALGQWIEAEAAWRRALAIEPTEAIRKKLDARPPAEPGTP